MMYKKILWFGNMSKRLSSLPSAVHGSVVRVEFVVPVKEHPHYY